MLLSIRLSYRVDFILHSRRFSVYFLQSRIIWSTVSGTLYNSQVGGVSSSLLVDEFCVSNYDSWGYDLAVQAMLFLTKSFLTIFCRGLDEDFQFIFQFSFIFFLSRSSVAFSGRLLL